MKASPSQIRTPKSAFHNRACYTPAVRKHQWRVTEGAIIPMEAERLDHYRQILLEQLRQHSELARGNQADALEIAANDDGVKDVADQSVKDVSQEIEYRLSERES